MTRERNRPGVLYRYKDMLIKHYGIHTERGTVIHNHPTFGMVVETSYKEFATGEFVTCVQREMDWLPDDMILQRARSKIGKNYKLLRYNCEDFINDVRYGKSFSKQRNWAFFILALIPVLVGVIALIKRRKTLASIMFLLLLAVGGLYIYLVQTGNRE